jgi:molybdenum cofactor cytidylyltransferase
VIAAVILAAGGSLRLGRPKQLVRSGGRSLIRIAVEAATGAGCRPVVVVLGAAERPVRVALRGLDVRRVTNHAWSQGLAGSIRCGLLELRRDRPEPEAVVLMGCDQPKVSAEVIAGLISAYRGRRDSTFTAAACAYAGVLGTPALFARSEFGKLETLRGDRGAGGLLRADPGRVVAVDWHDGATDVDEPADLPGLPCGDTDPAL